MPTRSMTADTHDRRGVGMLVTKSIDFAQLLLYIFIFYFIFYLKTSKQNISFVSFPPLLVLSFTFDCLD